MTSGNWTNSDNLFLQFGTAKATAETVGDYKALGENRVAEAFIDLTTLTTTVAILSNTFFMPPAGGTSGANSNTWFIERVELDVETAATTGTSATLKVGLIQQDRATVPTNYDHALINAETQANMNVAGDKQVYVGTDSLPAGSTHGGTLIGSTPAASTGPYYLTAQTGTGTFTAGKVRVRIYYRGIGTITQ